MKKKLLSSAPWREEPKKEAYIEEAKVKATNQPGQTPTMYLPSRNKNKLPPISSSSTSSLDPEQEDADSLSSIDPELSYSFHRNIQFLRRVFSIDTVVKPLPPALAYDVSRNLSFFTRIFTQFFDPQGIADVQKSLGMGQEERARRVR